MNRMFAAIVALAIVSPWPAHASGGLWCDVDDAGLKLEIRSGVTRGLGSPFFGFTASAETKDPRILQEFRTLRLEDKLVHHWLGNEVKLSFYHEIEKPEAIYTYDLVIETEMLADSDGVYEGSYRLAANGPAPEGEDGTVELTGSISCGAD